MFRIKILSLFFVVSFFSSYSQIIKQDSIVLKNIKQLEFNYKQLIIPSILIGYGIVAIESDQLLQFNSNIRQEVNEHIDEKITIDDFAQYAPLASTFVLGFTGIEGKNKTKDKLIIATTSALIMSLTTTVLKNLTKVERPDKTAFNSFPSGHTATSFMGAELLYQEYKNVSIWYGISGYLVASGVGAFRMYNNRHWLSDVLAGAGIGILSTKAAYFLYPTVNKIFKTNKNTKTAFLPLYDGKNLGFGLVSTF